MSTLVDSWADVSQAEFDAALAVVSTVVTEMQPATETRLGAVHDLVLRPYAALFAANRVEQSRMLQSGSLLAITRDPDLADPDTVDQVYSNYNVVRQTGAKASGQITLVLSRAASTVIPAGFVFTSGDRRFVTLTSFAGRLSSNSVLSSTDRVLVQQLDGTWTFEIEVEAVDVGVSGLLRRGDPLQASRAVLNLVRVAAADDFSGGRDVETTAELVQRAQLGVAAQTWSNTSNITKLVQSFPDRDDFAVSVIGAGNAEQLRDKHSVLPLVHGNRVDLWVRSPRPPLIQTIELSAVYTGTGVNGAAWRLVVARDKLPGAYSIVAASRRERPITSTVTNLVATRKYVAAVGDPDIANALEAAFSIYQSFELTFTDPPLQGEDLVADVSTATFAVTAMLPEGVADIQAGLDAADVRPPVGDVVVRGAVPCAVSIELYFTTLTGVPRADISSAIVREINTSAFAGAVYASRIARIVSDYLPDGVDLVRIRLAGIVTRPDGQVRLTRDRDILAVESDAAAMTTDKTVAYVCETTAISYSIEGAV